MIVSPAASEFVMRTLSRLLPATALALALAAAGAAGAQQTPAVGLPGPTRTDVQPPAMSRLDTREGDYTARNFRFRSGETLPQLRLHYTTLGTPRRDAAGHVTNAVMVLHGTGGSGGQFLRPQFAGVLFTPGGVLDPAKYFIILPDGIGHGKSSKPSDGLHARFPKYDYDDMVAAQHLLLTEGLKVDSLRVLMGTSMGCMHGFVWGETYPGFAKALMPMACQTVPIAGRNRVWRKMVMDAITTDPDWKGGDYTAQPTRALRTAEDLLIVAGTSPLPMQIAYPTRDAADAYLKDTFDKAVATLDANDLLYQVNSSRNYDPHPNLERITVPVMWINSGDDFINPPEIPLPAQEVKRMPRATFLLIPAGEQTHGHGTHTWAALWQDKLVQVLKDSQ
jgi:homoserine O-acetyltransferase